MDAFVNAIFGPLEPGKVYMHAAPIGMGKTTLAMQTCLSCALTCDGPVSYYFDWEHNTQLLSWIASYSARIGRLDFLNREPNPMARLESIAPQINRSLKIADFVLDTTLADLLQKGVNAIRELVDQDQGLCGYPGVGLIVIDGLGAMSEATGWSSSRDSLRATVAQLRQLAIEQECPVYATHQLNARENDVAEGLPPDPAATSNCRNLLKHCEIGVASGILDRKNHRRTVFRFFGYESVRGRDDVTAYLSAEIAEWRLTPDAFKSTNSEDSQKPSNAADWLTTLRDIRQSSNTKESRECEPPIDSSKPADLSPRTMYHALCDGQRSKKCGNSWIAKLIIPIRGYVWQLLPSKPTTGLWTLATHDLLLSQTGQVRSYRANSYLQQAILQPRQIKRDHQVLFAVVTSKEPLSLRALARILSRGHGYHSIKHSVERLVEAGLLVRDKAKRVSPNWPTADKLQPVFPDHLSNQQCDQRISRFVGQHYRRHRHGVSEHALRTALPIGHERLARRLIAMQQTGRVQRHDGVYLPTRAYSEAGLAEFPASPA